MRLGKESRRVASRPAGEPDPMTEGGWGYARRAEEATARISRRRMLGGAAAGAAAVATGTIGQVSTAKAANGDPLLLGQTNTSATSTVLNGGESGPAGSALVVINSQPGGPGIHAQPGADGRDRTHLRRPGTPVHGFWS